MVYDSGFEQRMTRREASLILELPYVSPASCYGVGWAIADGLQ